MPRKPYGAVKTEATAAEIERAVDDIIANPIPGEHEISLPDSSIEIIVQKLSQENIYATSGKGYIYIKD